MSKAQFSPFALAFVSLPVLAAGKPVGTCVAEVTGAKTVKIQGTLYEGAAPSGAVTSSASSRAWMLKNADEYRPRSDALATQTAKLADELTYVLMISCASDQGRVGFQPYGSNAKVQDYPSGPKTYRLVKSDAKDAKSGDLQALAMLPDLGFDGMLVPKEPGTLTLTQNDGDKLVGTYEFHSAKWSIKGSFNFTRPKPSAK